MTGSRDMGEFGTLTLPTGGVDRPLVTFALFAYNQEAYIREAVEGAFAQTYSPLEIILSDDCSADRTFEIMQEMAAEYRGPHQVRVRRSMPNLGLIKHIDAVAQMANGRIIVMAAGDDISLPHRVDRLAQVFLLNRSAHAVLSDFEVIGTAAKRDRGLRTSRVVPTTELLISAGGAQIGATYAYSRDSFEKFGPIAPGVTDEDRILPFRASLLGKVFYLHEVLVQYRISANQAEVATRMKRVHGYSNPLHWTALADALVRAASIGAIGFLRVSYLRTVLAMSVFVASPARPEKRSSISRLIAESVLRILRRLSRILSDYRR